VEQGKETAKFELLNNLIQNLHLTFEQAADALEISAEERKRFADKI
jgi:DNA-binding Lrp family transcriptional regulator